MNKIMKWGKQTSSFIANYWNYRVKIKWKKVETYLKRLFDRRSDFSQDLS